MLLLEAPQNARTCIYQPPAKSSPKQELGVTGISSSKKIFLWHREAILNIVPIVPSGALEAQKHLNTF